MKQKYEDWGVWQDEHTTTQGDITNYEGFVIPHEGIRLHEWLPEGGPVTVTTDPASMQEKVKGMGL